MDGYIGTESAFYVIFKFGIFWFIFFSFFILATKIHVFAEELSFGFDMIIDETIIFKDNYFIS